MSRTSGQLRMITYVGDRSSAYPDFAVLRIIDAPQTSSFLSRPFTTNEGEGDEFGDYECKQLPELPTMQGLFVLEWPWVMVTHPEDPDDTTAQYGVGIWRRPTLREVSELVGDAPVSA